MHAAWYNDHSSRHCNQQDYTAPGSTIRTAAQMDAHLLRDDLRDTVIVMDDVWRI
jgi:hypothetical protein